MPLRLALRCGPAGDIASALPGRPLPVGAGSFAALLDPACRAKGAQFLAEIQNKGAAAGWELLVREGVAGATPQLLRFAGVAGTNEIYVTAEVIPADLFDEVAQLNNSLVNAQRELAREKSALARANQDLVDFAAVVSHDLRAPLRNIRQVIALMEERVPAGADDRLKEWLEHVARNAGRMQTLIDDTLASVRPGPGWPAAVAVALNELVDRASAQSRFVSRGNLPVVRGVVSQLEILFQNLFENAEQHQQPGQPLQVHVSAEPAGPERWRIAVRDNGQGIPAEMHGQIFERFATGDSGGTGIGLATCRQVVRRMGGEISVESAAGQGATFFFTLPAA